MLTFFLTLRPIRTCCRYLTGGTGLGSPRSLDRYKHQATWGSASLNVAFGRPGQALAALDDRPFEVPRPTAHTTPQKVVRWQLLPDGASVGRPSTLLSLFLQSHFFIANNCSRSSRLRLTRCPRPRLSTAFRINLYLDLYSSVPLTPKYRKSVLKSTFARSYSG